MMISILGIMGFNSVYLFIIFAVVKQLTTPINHSPPPRTWKISSDCS